jgi:hypothetical protein
MKVEVSLFVARHGICDTGCISQKVALGDLSVILFFYDEKQPALSSFH